MTDTQAPSADAGDLRSRLKRSPALTRGVRYGRSWWSDLSYRLLCEVGRVPWHDFRYFWYRRAGMALPSSSSIHWRAEFYFPHNITIGENTVIGYSVFLDARQPITIGRNVNFSSNVQVFTWQHDIDDPYFGGTGGPVRIDDYVFVGPNVIILPGVHIGEGAVIGAGSVVTKDVEPYSVSAGVPAVHRRYRSRDLRYELRYRKRFS